MKKECLDVILHRVMAFVGGYFGAFALLNFNDIFASAQTTNLIDLIECLVGADFNEFILRILMLAVYVTGLCTPVLLEEYGKGNLHRYSLFLDLSAILIVWWIPSSWNVFLSLYPVCFAMAFQWSSFPGASGYISSCIFSTNNIKQFVTSAVLYVCRRKEENRKKAAFFGFVLLCFHLGVFLCCLTSSIWGKSNIVFCLPMLFMAGVIERQMGRDTQKNLFERIS